MLFFLPLLLAFLVGLTGSGLVFAAAASSLAGHVEVERALGRAWAGLTQPARSRAGEFGRPPASRSSACSRCCGPARPCRPSRSLFGALLAFEGLRELFALVAPHLEEVLTENAREFLLARARQCQKQRGRLPSILAVDFALTGDVVAAAAELNGRR